MAQTASDPLVEHLRSAGIVAPRITIREAKRAGLRLELACALLEKESGGGHNVFGHDASIFRGAGAVTRSSYARYKRQRVASRNRSMQGVGPCQLTWWELQDTADAQGGCWRPEINMRTGFSHLASLVKRYGESDGARRYNGTGADAEAYSRDLLVKARRWEAIVDGLESPVTPVVARPARVVRRGDTGKRVQNLTDALAHVHSPGTDEPYLAEATSRAGAAVIAAIRQFQRDHGLLVDGIAGPKTMKAVRRARRARPERNGHGGGLGDATPDRKSVV